jgi:putative phosphoesterase
MLVGILSDTHDRTDPLITAIDMLRGRGTQHFIHCGDVGGEQVLDVLAGLPAVTFIWGNNDWDTAGLEDYAAHLGLTCAGRFAELTLDGKLFAVSHGDNFTLKKKLMSEQKYDYFLQGHTHVFADETFGRTRLINPGALHRAHPKTVALLDTATGHLEKIIVAS